MMNKMLTITNMMKKKIPKMTKITMPEITNTAKWVKTSYLMFYKNQINFRSHMKLRNNKELFSRKQKIITKKTYSKIQKKTMRYNMKKTSS